MLPFITPRFFIPSYRSTLADAGAMGLGLGRRSDIPGHRGRRPGRARVVGRYPEPNFAGSGTTQTDARPAGAAAQFYLKWTHDHF